MRDTAEVLTSPSNSNTLRDMSTILTDSLSREVEVVCKHLNSTLSQYTTLGDYLPLDASNLFEKLRDGVVLGYLLAHYFPDSLSPKTLVHGLDMDQLDKPYSKVTFEVNSNLNTVINVAKSVKSLIVVNLGAEDILNGRRELILGLLWQILNGRLLKGISIRAHPGLLMLAEPTESLTEFANLKPEVILLRWFNFHLQTASWPRKVANFNIDLCDSELYAVLLNQLMPKEVVYDEVVYLLSIPSNNSEGNLARANLIVDFARRLACSDFISAEAIANGNSKINIAFVASLFNNYSSLQIPSQLEVNRLQMTLDELKKENSSLSQKIYKTCEANTILEKQNADLSKTQVEERQRMEGEIAKQKSQHVQEMERLILRHKDEIQTIIENERHTFKNSLAVLEQREQNHQTKVKYLLQCCRSLCNADIKGSLEAQESTDLTKMLEILSGCIEAISTKINDLNKDVEDLKQVITQKEHINEIMGEKIKEYTEHLIIGKKGEKTRRGSIIKRLFDNGQS